MNAQDLKDLGTTTQIIQALMNSVSPQVFALALQRSLNDSVLWPNHNKELCEESCYDQFIGDWSIGLKRLIDASTKLVAGDYDKIHDIFLKVIELEPEKENDYDTLFFGETTIDLKEARKILNQLTKRKNK